MSISFHGLLCCEVGKLILEGMEGLDWIGLLDIRTKVCVLVRKGDSDLLKCGMMEMGMEMGIG